MQILPATGRALNVGNAEKRKPTINAGVRCTRLPAMPYLKETGSDSLNRILFCFATYYVGPEQGLRETAQSA